MSLPGGYTLRGVKAEDAVSVAGHRYPEAADHAERPVYAAWLAGALAAGRYEGIMAECRGEVVAGAGLTLLEWGPTRGHPGALRGRLINVWTHPEHRRRGLARTLCAHLLAWAQSRGVGTVGLGSTPQARDLYRSLGFAPQPAEMKWEAPR
ncbi:GNAT family N-acetyltransferase [Deinococcus petrolearius]|uniref:GNAT family N-acetyltransferase n=1 Tax=Deinococcus petrolearius TaxID=1751295 RepID=A0ABW1DF66_9DEIO